MPRKKQAKKKELYLDNRVQLFLGKFFSGGLDRFHPVLDEEWGYRYPNVEAFVNKPDEAEPFLKSLEGIGLLSSETCGLLLCCPDCGSCSVSPILKRLQGNPSSEANAWKCRKCGALIEEGSISVRPISYFKFSKEGIDRISDELAIKPLLEFLQERGYETESPGYLRGESKVMHAFDITARGEDSKDVKIVLDFVVSDEPVDEERVAAMFAKVYDTNPPRSLFVAFPGLTENARKLAQQYEIDVVETRNLNSLWKDLRQTIPPVDEFKFETLDVMTLLSLPDHLRKTASVVCEKGKTNADEIAEATKRARAVESGYLNQLVRMGYLKKEREGRQVLFSVIS